MQILLNLSPPDGPYNWLQKSRTLGIVIKDILECNVRSNLLYLSLHKGVPDLYASGVRYENEPNWKFQGESVEEFALIPIIIARGWGDCDDLGPWRCAELVKSGERATIRIQWQRPILPDGSKGRKLFHIVVRRGDGKTIEDPSAKLGMHER